MNLIFILCIKHVVFVGGLISALPPVKLMTASPVATADGCLVSYTMVIA